MCRAQNTFQIGADGVASTITQQSASQQGIAAAPGVTVLAPGGAPTISANPELVRLAPEGGHQASAGHMAVWCALYHHAHPSSWRRPV